MFGQFRRVWSGPIGSVANVNFFEKCPRRWVAVQGNTWNECPKIIASNGVEVCRIAVDGQRNDSDVTWAVALKIANSVNRADDTVID